MTIVAETLEKGKNFDTFQMGQYVTKSCKPVASSAFLFYNLPWCFGTASGLELPQAAWISSILRKRQHMKVKIISDSTCDLSPDLVQKYDIAITPLSVSLGGTYLKDGSEIKPDDIYAYVSQSGKLPKTSAVNVNEYRRVYEQWTAEGYAVVQICISSLFSACYANACQAAKNMENVFVVDSMNLSTGQGLVTLHAAEMAAAGADAKAIYESCKDMVPRVEASFVIDTLDYLYKGGRCNALAMFGANLLHLKPCIEVQNGAMLPTKKFRGRMGKVMLDYVEDRLKDRTDIDTHRIFITHTKCDPADVQAVRNKILELVPDFEEILETNAGSTVTTHCGAGTLGILFVRKEK